jgi:alanyl-tRNA synthetase
MRHHTGTHLLLGAARRVLGQHVWQVGAQKGVESSRVDISHYEKITDDQAREIERRATEVALQDIPVESEWMPREKAEQQYGFRLYQGGVVPGRELRIIKIDDWDVEACGGTHCTRTGQIGTIKILRTERIQDGVERIIFAAGIHALAAFQNYESMLQRISSISRAPLEQMIESVQNTFEQYARFSRLKQKDSDRQSEQWAAMEHNQLLQEGKIVGNVRLCTKQYRGHSEDEMILVIRNLTMLDRSSVAVLVLIGETVRIFVGAGRDAVKSGIHSGKLAKELAKIVGGSGGGKDFFGQGGGTKLSAVDVVVRESEQAVKEMLTK